MSARRLLIVLMNTDPRNPEELGAPFYYAAVAAAMDHPVDVLCTATAGKLMLRGVAEAINPKFEDEYWRESYASRNYVREGEDYETFAPAYRYGWESYSLYPHTRFDELEPELRRGWERSEWNAGLAWERAREAVRDAWRRVERTFSKRD